MITEPTPMATVADPLANILDWFKKLRPGKILAITLSVAGLSSAIATWVVMTGGDEPLNVQSDTLGVLVIINFVLLLTLGTLIARRMLGLWRAMKQGAVGSRLQSRIVLIFSLVTISPTIMVSVFSAIFFQVGIKTWFDDRVQTAVEESVAVAESYLEEHKGIIRADALAMASDFKRNLAVIATSPAVLTSLLDSQAAIRNLTEAIVFTNNRIIARTELSFSLEFERLPQHVLELADAGNIVVLADDEDKIRALVKLDEVSGIYLLIGRNIDPKVINHMVVAQGAVNQYRKLQQNISDIQLHFTVLFILVAMLLLLAAIWYGMYVAIRLVIPITRLIQAAEKVRGGDFSAQVPESSKQDELEVLGRTFNKMMQQLERQRKELTTANRQLDERRRFTEAVFAGVSAGVVALNKGHVITLNNRIAAQLLLADELQSMKGMPITALIADIAPLLQVITQRPAELAETNMTIERGSKRLNLHVRIATEMKGEEIEGYIVTFDDITELVGAQRSAAWSDVARRIAHEIKNPLTPITLSADRLRKKYMPQLASDEDRESFKRYVDTISKHVKDIGQMVEEFASFARMPTPTFADHDMRQTVREALFSARTAYPHVAYHSPVSDHPVMARYDDRQIVQVLVNLFKNAAEAFEHISDSAKPRDVWITFETIKDKTRMIIEDNGVGFPPDKMDSLTEPYVTTRAKGTGLGLAIVKKHMEEHKGSLILENRKEGGARVILVFPQH